MQSLTSYVAGHRRRLVLTLLVAIVAPLGVLASIFFLGGNATATPTCSIYWTGASSSDWGTKTNWSKTDGGPAAPAVPGAADYVCMSTTPVGGATVVYNGSANVTVLGINWPVTATTSPSLELQGGTFVSGSSATPPGSTIAKLVLSGATYKPVGGTTVTAKATFSGGTLSTGTVTLTSGGIGSLSSMTFAGATFLNQGTTTQVPSTSVTLGSKSVIENASTMILGNNGGIGVSDATANKLMNDAGATMSYDAPSSADYIYTTAPFTDNGAFAVSSGTAFLQGGGTFGATSVASGTGQIQLQSGTFTATAGANIGDTTVTGGTLAGSAAASRFGLLSGTVTGKVTADEVHLTGGTISGAAAQITVNTGGTGRLGAVTISAGKVLNNGALAQRDNVAVSNSGKFENAGTLTATDGAGFSANDATADAVLNDAGATVTFQGARSSSNLYISTGLTDAGTLDIPSGEIQLAGSNTFAATATTTGDGILYLQGASTSTSGATFEALSVSGTLAGNAVTDSLDLSGGTITAQATTNDLTGGGTISGAGSVTVLAGGIGNIQGTTITLDSGGKLVNRGTLTLGIVALSNASTFENAGTLKLVDDAYYGSSQNHIYANDSTSNKVLNDVGATINYKANTAGAVSYVAAPLTDSGAISVTRGTLQLTGGGTFGATSVASGTGIVNVASAFTASAGATLGRTIVDGTLAGSATTTSLTLAGTVTAAVSTQQLHLEGGTIGTAGAVTLGVGGTGDFSNGYALTVNGGGKLINKGSLVDDGPVYLSNASTFENAGVLKIRDGAYIGVNDATANTVLNDPGASMTYLSADQTGGVSVDAALTNSGTVESDRGTFTINKIAALTAAGALSGTGTYVVGGGTLTLPVAITSNAANLVQGGFGTFKSSATGENGLLTLKTNTGQVTVKRSVAFSAPTFTNSGTLNVLAGQMTTNAFKQTAGTTTVATGAKLQATSTTITGGTLTGNGTVIGPVSGAGTVAPPEAGGPLTVSSYTPTGTTGITIGSGGASQLAVTGTATLGGTLALTTDAGFDPPNGSTFTVLSASSISGTFASITGDNAGSHHYTVSYTPTSVVVTVGQPPAITSPAAATFTLPGTSTFAVTTTGYPTPSLSVSSALPAGVTFVDNGDGTGTLSASGSQAPGFVNVNIVASSGGFPDASQPFTLDNLAFSSVSPKPIARGISNRAITLAGGGFASGATLSTTATGVSFNSVVLAADGSSITAKMSATSTASTGTFDVKVSQPGGTITCTSCILVKVPMSVTSFPATTLAGGAKAAPIAVTGSAFAGPVTISFLGATGLSGTVTAASTSATVKVTVGATATPGTYTMKLINGDGSSYTCTNCLVIVAGPTITSVTPSSVIRGQTTSVTIAGTGFSSDSVITTSGTGVTFANVVVTADGTSITADMTVPAATSTGGKSLTVTDGALGYNGMVVKSPAYTVTAS